VGAGIRKGQGRRCGNDGKEGKRPLQRLRVDRDGNKGVGLRLLKSILEQEDDGGFVCFLMKGLG
jgi:hypothetical protein